MAAHLHPGQVIGATDKHAAEATERPVPYHDAIATMYQHLGIDARGTTFADTTGRPQYLVDLGQLITGLI